MSTEPKTLLTPEQYLEIERQAGFKSEFYRGEMFAMAGAGWNHNLLVANAISHLRAQLGSRLCYLTPSDLRVHVTATGLYTYPDVTVVCGEPQFGDHHRDTLLNPTMLVEVLSPSTEAYDRGRKFENYRSIPSLQHYLLLASDRAHADLFTKRPDGHWILDSAGGAEETVELTAFGYRLRLSDLYEKVEFGQ